MELNASDERGIKVVREKIKSFAQVSVGAGNASLPPYKLIILDEADSMTPDAQSALRRTMETYSRVTRFCIICNYISRLITPISSRCAKFRFKPLPEEAMIGRLRFIAEQEGVAGATDGIFKELIQTSEGDMRRAIQTLQSLHRLYGEEMNTQAVLDMNGSLPTETIDLVLDVCRSNNNARVDELVESLLAEGYPVSQLVLQLIDRVVSPSSGISDRARAQIACLMAVADKQLVDGAGDYVQLHNLLAQCQRFLSMPAPPVRAAA